MYSLFAHYVGNPRFYVIDYVRAALRNVYEPEVPASGPGSLLKGSLGLSHESWVS
jgi:hypothetical protein